MQGDQDKLVMSLALSAATFIFYYFILHALLIMCANTWCSFCSQVSDHYYSRKDISRANK